jgi:putative glycosyltransferase
MRISIVTSLYNSSPYLNDFYAEYLNIIKESNLEYEFILVDDGSKDKSVRTAKEICLIDKNVKLIILSRNFGQHNAIYAGLMHSKHDYVFVCDVDLEDNPMNLKLMIDELKDENIDVVYSAFRERKGGVIRGNLGALFYTIFSMLTDQKIERNQSWQRLMKRKYVDNLLSFNEYESYTAGLMYLTGFNQKVIYAERKYKGISSYNFLKRFTQALNAIISFSSKPLTIISIFGFLITLISLIFIFYILLQKFFNVNYEAGWSSLILSIWLVGGMILSSLGIVGLYISKIFNQVKNRPKFIVKNIINEN